MARRPEKTSGPLLDQSGETVGYFEEYGIYRSEIRESDPRPPSLPGSAFVRKLRQLVEAARAELSAAGELIDLEITNAPAVVLAKDRRTATSRTLHDWFVGIVRRHGVRCRLQIAARFLVAWREVWQLTPCAHEEDHANLLSLRMAACFFADAWHYWHMEVSGEHASAAAASRSARGLAGGTAAVKKKRRSRETIILRVIGSDIDRKGARLLGKKYFNQINDALSRKLKDEALEQAIKRIQARRKDKAGKRPSK
jgi:hypothetical protein